MATGGRSLIWLEGDAETTRSRALTLLAHWPAARIGWIGTEPGDESSPLARGLHPLPPGQARQWLGQTLAAGVIDAHTGLDPDDLGALAGTIDGTGVMVLLSPPAVDWPLQGASGGSVFIQRLTDCLADDPAVQRPDGVTPLRGPPMPAAAGDDTPTADQQRAMRAVTRLAGRADGGTVLITADRGRGKSAALGLALRALPDGRDARLTAPSRAAAATALSRAGDAAPRFVAPEDITPADSLLLIDEAAALPLPLIIREVRRNPRCVLTGTVHGYEGSGRGLILRLAEALSDRPLEHLALHEPVRWAANDPLEALIDRVLLLSAEPRAPAPAGPVTVMPIDAADLAADEADLRDAFGLLVASHYQTRPRDLRQLLDDPAIRLSVARRQGRIIGILAARLEGGMDADLCHDIHHGRRRPAGHLIAQSLTFHAGVATAAGLRGRRIQRIAVHGDCRRQGIGQRLVAAARADARAAGDDWLGTSFGITPGLMDFWMACGMQPVRVGNHRDARSGTVSGILLEGLSAAGSRLCEAARQRLAVHLPDQLNHRLRDLSAPLRERLRTEPPDEHRRQAIDREDLHAFARGHRPLLDTHAALTRWAASNPTAAGHAPRDRALLTAAIETPEDTAALARAGGVSGRRAALARLRQLIAQSPRIDDE